jgi:hypothetical protein
MGSLIFLVLGLVTFIYGVARDDIRIFLGITLMGLAIAAGTPSYSTYLCEDTEGVVTAQKTAKRRWTLSNGESYHSRDFHDKCVNVPPPGLLDAEPLVSGSEP